MMKRLFLAIDLPKEIKNQLHNISYGIFDAKWIKQENLHLTLKFLGEAPAYQEKTLISLLSQINFPSFEIQIKDVGYFPLRGTPKILWAGIAESEPLIKLQKKIERITEKAEFDTKKQKFHPHITLARLKPSAKKRIPLFINKNSLFKTGYFKINKFTLYQSFLKTEGAAYQKVAQFYFVKGTQKT